MKVLLNNMGSDQSFINLLQNFSFLISLILIFDLLRIRLRRSIDVAKLILIGLLIGAIGIIVMYTPWVVTPGIVFDTRSVLLSISGLFFGLIPTLIAMVLTITFRVMQGGAGALTGSLVIIATAIIGLLWRHLRKEPLEKIKWWQMYVFGIIVHMIMLALMLTLPKENIQPVLSSISLPVMVIYPIGNLLLGLILRNRLNREQIHKNLADITNRLKTAEQISRIGGWDYDVKNEVIYWTDEVFRIHGFTNEEIYQGTSVLVEKSLARYHPDDRKLIEEAFQKCVQNGTPYDLEIRFISATGEQKWVRTIGDPIFDKDAVVKINGIIMDITEKKIAENELIASESKFSNFVERAPVGIVITDTEDKTILANQKFIQITGYTKEEFPSINEWWVLAYPDTEYRKRVQKDWQNLVEKALITGRDINPYESTVRCKDGIDRHLEIGFVSTGFNKIITFVDITKRKIAEEKLRESETNFRNLSESAPVGVVVISDNKIEYINPAGVNLVGASNPSQVIGKPIIEFLHRTRLMETRNNIQKLMNGQVEEIQFENIFLNLDRLPVYVETIGTRIIYQEKQAIQVIITDISDRKAMEEKRQQDQKTLHRLLAEAEKSRKVLLSLIEDQRRSEEEIRILNRDLEQRVKQRTAQLEASNKELEAFAYSVSHDLRAPLRGINGFSFILESEYAEKLDEEGKRILGVIRQNAQKMDHLITDLLALSRVSRGDIRFIQIDMKHIVESVFRELATQEVKEKFQFKLNNLPPVEADPTLMNQVWTNLISNSIKYTFPKEQCKIEIGAIEEENSITYYIRDNGVGYDSQYGDKLFGLFQRFHNERDFEGTGIGLAIVKRIIDRHHGKIWSKSLLGERAEFYFSIPKNLKMIIGNLHAESPKE